MITSLPNSLHSYFRRSALPAWCVLAMDCFFAVFAGLVSIYLENNIKGYIPDIVHIISGLVVLMLVFIVFFRVFHTYSGILRYSTYADLRRVACAVLCGSTATLVLQQLNVSVFHLGVALPGLNGCALLFILTVLLMGFARILVKSLFESLSVMSESEHAFVYGVREGAIAVAKAVGSGADRRFTINGFISPDGYLVSSYLMGVRVYPDTPNLLEIMQGKNATALFVSPVQANVFRKQTNLIKDFTQAGIKIYMMPDPEEWDGISPLSHNQFRPIEIEDLLARDPIAVDMKAIAELLRDRTVMITGAAGSIGSEMVRQVIAFFPKKLILIDQAETPMHDLRLEISDKYAFAKSETIVASITNKECMESIFERTRPEFVFHAAAYKHVPMMEDNPAIAVQNNVQGTRIIADLAVKYGVRKFVMISTDKAVNPTNVMGCSKRICEIYCQSLNKAIQDGRVTGVTQFITTRFGNVLGSNGSVIPIFRRQLKAGGPITVTHPDIVRYFMLIPEACKLVLEAGTLGRGGEIFVFDMGEPVKILDLARRMIALSGVKNVEIKFTGLRDGEKLYEEVLADSESVKDVTINPKIKIAMVREYDYEEACANEDRLLEASRNFDSMEIVRIMKEIVPEYKSRNSVFEALDSPSTPPPCISK